MSRVPRSDLILGGVRSGKSREALRVAASMPRGSRGAFLATAQALDGDMEARIARHRAERPTGWATLEEPYDVVRACGSLAGRVDVVVLDCLTLWVSNLLGKGATDAEIVADAERVAAAAGGRPGRTIVVTNEVGLGIVPFEPETRRFRDLLGKVNTVVSDAAEKVGLLVTGRVLWLDERFDGGLP